MVLLPIVTRTRLTVVKAALNLGKDKLRRSKRPMFSLGSKYEADTRDGRGAECLDELRGAWRSSRARSTEEENSCSGMAKDEWSAREAASKLPCDSSSRSVCNCSGLWSERRGMFSSRRCALSDLSIIPLDSSLSSTSTSALPHDLELPLCSLLSQHHLDSTLSGRLLGLPHARGHHVPTRQFSGKRLAYLTKAETLNGSNSMLFCFTAIGRSKTILRLELTGPVVFVIRKHVS